MCIATVGMKITLQFVIHVRQQVERHKVVAQCLYLHPEDFPGFVDECGPSFDPFEPKVEAQEGVALGMLLNMVVYVSGGLEQGTFIVTAGGLPYIAMGKVTA